MTCKLWASQILNSSLGPEGQFRSHNEEKRKRMLHLRALWWLCSNFNCDTPIILRTQNINLYSSPKSANSLCMQQDFGTWSIYLLRICCNDCILWDSQQCHFHGSSCRVTSIWMTIGRGCNNFPVKYFSNL